MLDIWVFFRRFSPLQLSLICVATAFVAAVAISHLFWYWLTGAVPDGLTLVAGGAAVLVSVPMVHVFVIAVYRLDDTNQRLMATKTKLHLQNEELAKTRNALATLNEELEGRVADRTVDLQDALRTAESANAAKAEFLANMSHELRTPLNGILGFADMIANRHTLFPDASAEKTDDYAAAILVSGRHLNAMVNDLLDLSKIDYGEFEINPVSVSTAELVSDVVAELGPTVTARNQRVEVNHAGGDLPLQTDVRAAHQILANVLSNALKYSSDGDTVSVDVTSGAAEVSFVVTDRGIGMSADAIAKATTPFSRFSNAHIASGQSVGLGLSIVKKLCGVLGGTLDISSVEGAGTAVRITLPVRCSVPGTTLALAG